ncbi:MAG: hypothetical protein J7K35_06570 [Syntrophobacterales bacterium]|nr:hypothetical protein [Syntrophobacterales bacterium]
MISNDKPNPFQVLALPTNATNQDIVERGQELCDLAESDEQRLLYRWAIEQLITKSITRLEYELYEIPDTKYENSEWEHFTRFNKRNPVKIAALAKEIPPPSVDDFNMPEVVMLLLDALLKVPGPDIKTAVDNSPFKPGIGSPPLEVRDVIFG